MREFVEQKQLRFFRERRRIIEFFERRVADAHEPRRDARKTRREFLEIGTPFGFDPSDHDAQTRLLRANRIVEQAPGFSGTRGAREIDR